MSKKTLHQLCAEHTGKVSDKWSLYLTEYDRLFDDYRNKPVCLLEIGVQNGGSLEIWSKYFSNASALIGCDIDPDCARLSYDDPRIGVIVGDANARDTSEQVFNRCPQFDIVIDDGSHLSSDIIKSFALYFPRVVKDGVFIAEDLHCSYRDKWEGGLFDPYSSISFFKRLADIINHEHWGITKTRTDILRGIFTKYGCEIDAEALTQVHSVEFINSMCVVRKAPAADNGLGRRVISGSTELVVPDLRDLLDPVFDQSSNPWTARTIPPDEVIQHTELALANTQQQIVNLNQTVAERDAQIVNLNQAVAERDVQIANLNQAVAERDAQIANLNQAVAERDAQIANLNQAVAERDVQIVNLNQAVVERDGQIVNLNQAVAERDVQIANLNQAVVKRDGQIVNLNQAVAERDFKLSVIRSELHSIYSSKKWKLIIKAAVPVSLAKAGISKMKKRVKRWRQSAQQRNFNAKWYLKQNPDVAMSGMDPYKHYVAYGKAEGRLPAPDSFFVRGIKRAIMLTVLPVALNRSGGIRQAIRKVCSVFKREGWEGVKRKVIFLYSQVTHNNYAKWIRRYDTLTNKMRTKMRAHIETLPTKPLISVVMPVYNPKPVWLKNAIKSVRQQIYPHWELCIADDASTDKAIRAILERYAREDTRIKVVFREQNGHISAASNSAIKLATGEWVALLDHDDLLAEHALFWVADAINRKPDVRLIYSDEDKVNESGKRFDPYFKCDWNVDLFYSHNLITHLGVYHTSILREVGGFRLGLEGAQDYDLALRCIEHINPNQIHHIPRVLYHWRMHAKSTAQTANIKPYAFLAGEKALNEHFRRQEVNATAAELLGRGMYRVRYALPEVLPLVSLIIPTRNRLRLLQKCIESILKKTTYPNYEILIVDNGSDDPATLQYLKELQSEPRVRVVRDDRPFNYSALNNAAVKLAIGEVVGLLNNDLEVISPEWLSEMVSHALRPGVGAVGARLWYLDETLQHGGVVLGLGGVAGHAHKNLPRDEYGYFCRGNLIQNFSSVTAACLVIRKSLYEKVGGFNELDFQIAFNDVDFCLRVREAGFRNIWTPYAELYHYESATRGFEDTPEKKARFSKEMQCMKRRWGNTLLNDPAYSPNLTFDREDFSLAWPPRVEPLPEPFPPGRLPHVQSLDSTSPGPTIQQSPANRNEKALFMIDRNGLGLEIGPSHNPLAPKKHGFNVHILDHATAGELRMKYKEHGVNLENIEDVDFVWHGQPLHELIGREQYYDWIIASHVIEHTPDLITFLMECERLLKTNGVLSLVIPDKRYCFDYFNAPTSTGELLDAFEQKRKRPSPGKVFDYFAGAAKRNGQIAWGQGTSGVIEFVHSFDDARSQWNKAKVSDEYIDVHNWRFIPASFHVILGDLQSLGLTGFGIKAEFDTDGCEFFVTLGKSKSHQFANRLLAVKRVFDET